MKKLVGEAGKRYTNMAPDAVRTICDIIGIKYDTKLHEKMEEKQDMCKAIEEWAMEERQEGRLETLISLVKENLLPLAEAAKWADMSENEFGKLCS